MRFLCFVAIYIFSSFAQASWQIHILKKDQAPKGYKEWGLLQRFIDTNQGSFSIATISTAVYDIKGHEPKTEDDLAKKIEASIPGLRWKKELYKGVSVYTAYLEKDLRYFKMFVKDQGQLRIMTLSNIRQPYVLGTTYETEYLQRFFMKTQLEKSEKFKKTSWLWDSFQPPAEALMNGADFARMFSTYVRGITDNVGIKSAQVIAASGDGIANEASNIASAVNKVGDRIGDSNRILSQFSSEKKLAQLAAASGVGFAVGSFAGSLLVNFMADGSYKLLREAFYAFRGGMKPEDWDQSTKKSSEAMETLKKSMDQINDLDQEIAIMGMAMSKLTDMPGKDLVENLENQMIDKADQVSRLKNNLAALSDSSQREQCVNAVRKLEDDIFYLSNLKPLLLKLKSKEAVCQKIYEAFRSWKTSAASLQRAKNIVTQEMLTFIGNIEKNEKDSMQPSAAAEKMRQECIRIKKDLVAAKERQFKDMGCSESADSDCQMSLRAAEDHKASLKNCDSDYELMLSAQTPYSSARQTQLLNDQLQITRERLAEIAKMDCRKDDPRRLCTSSKEGDLSLLNEVYDSRMKDFKKTCPTTQVSESVNSAISLASVAAQVPDEKADQAQTGKGFFAQAKDYLGSLLGRLKFW